MNDNQVDMLPERGKILLVDDDIAILKLLENAFTQEDYKVYICEDSVLVMDLVAIIRPDIIILDIIMPEINGYEILEEIKSKPQYSDIHVIFLSAKGDADEKIKGIKSGADDFITKPFVIEEVIARAETIMRRSRHYKDKLIKDTLTDAYSRYYFNQKIAEEFERFKRNHIIFSIAFIDVDRFKYINDRYGHQIGDYVLKEFVTYLTKNIRKSDSIYRYGGEEFVILMPNTPKEKAYVVIERLRQNFSRETISIDGLNLRGTFSAGINQICTNAESIEKIISDADVAMYYAKSRGRNKVVKF